jgi:CheY-like chemotaxis protein
MRILIVDDDPHMVEVLAHFLEPITSKIETTSRLQTAIELSTTRKFNVIILDLLLEDSTKEKTLDAIKIFKSHQSAVVVVSGVPEPTIEQQAKQAGADAFVPKDNTFGKSALIIATNVALMNMPRTSPKSESFESHVETLRRMAQSL